MRHFSIHTILLLLSLLITSPVVECVSGEQFEDESECVFSVMAFGDRSFEGIYYEIEEGDAVELVFSPYGRSRGYRVPKDVSFLEFFSETRNSKGELIRVLLSRFDRSQILDRGLLVFFPNYDRDSELPYKVIGVDESAPHFIGGDFRFLNLTGADLLAKIGDDEVLLESGFSKVFRFDAQDRKPISFQFAVDVAGVWELVYATKRQSDMRNGTLFILKPPIQLDSLDIGVNALVETLR